MPNRHEWLQRLLILNCPPLRTRHDKDVICRKSEPRLAYRYLFKSAQHYCLWGCSPQDVVYKQEPWRKQQICHLHSRCDYMDRWATLSNVSVSALETASVPSLFYINRSHWCKFQCTQDTSGVDRQMYVMLKSWIKLYVPHLMHICYFFIPFLPYFIFFRSFALFVCFFVSKFSRNAKMRNFFQSSSPVWNSVRVKDNTQFLT